MKKILAFAMAAVLMLGLAACGGSGASAPASSAAGSASASSGASSQDSAGGTSVVEEIQEKGVLTMMTATGFPPFEYLGEDGKPAGVDIDLAQLVADELGVELEVLDMDFNLLIESLKSGKGQLIAAGMTATTLRERISLCRRARPLTSTHRKSLALNRWRLKMPMNALRL